MSESTKISRDREILTAAHERGSISTFFAFFRLSGPGWLQSAITLGGGSLGSALYLGVLGGTAMLWLNLVAIIVGVIMLSAISYVVLSSGERPYKAINEHVNPVLGVGWLTATILANVIWCLPQFSLCFDTLQTNLLPEQIPDTDTAKYIVSAILFVLAFIMVILSLKRGWAAKIFDLILKLVIAAIVICFVAVVVLLTQQDQLNWNEILTGLIPRPDQWFGAPPTVQGMLSSLPEASQSFWSSELLDKQRQVMISTTATVVGINMTFLLPYSMINRGWDRPFRGLAKFDLITGLAIPFLLVTSCIVIASAFSFHAQADEEFLSDDPAVVLTSPLFGGTKGSILDRIESEDPNSIEELNAIADADERAVAEGALLAQFVADMPQEERKLAAMLVKPNAAGLSKTLSPLLGDKTANLVFGIGTLGMGFSTIIILMMINGFAIAELFHRYDSMVIKSLGAAFAGLFGVFWPFFWAGGSKTWLIIVASTFGAIFLPIAYIAFFALMNRRELLKDDMPTGVRRWIWNTLMLFGVIAALAQAISALQTKLTNPSTGEWLVPDGSSLVLGGVVTFALLAIIGFSARRTTQNTND